jgi:hypothetical protein
MKSIKLPKLARFEIKLDGAVYDTHKARENHEAYSQNVREVIFSAATIEHMLKDYVTNFICRRTSKARIFPEHRHSIRFIFISACHTSGANYLGV